MDGLPILQIAAERVKSNSPGECVI